MIRRLAARLGRAALAFRYALAAAAGATLIAFGVFDGGGSPGQRLAGDPARALLPALAALVLGALLVARLAAAAAGMRRAATPPVVPAGARGERASLQHDLELGALLLVCAYAAFQATGGPHSILQPLSYALVAFLVTFQRPAVATPLVALAAALELALARACPALAVPSRVFHDDRLPVAAHLAFLAFFALIHRLFLRAEVARERAEHRARLDGEVRRLRDEARDFRLIGSQLAAESRARGRAHEEEIIAAASVDNIHQALFYTLELLKKSLDLHTCVLLWLDETGEALRIKELLTDSDAITASAIPIDAGALGAVVKDRVPVQLVDPKREHLPYYDGDGARPVGAFLGVPVIEDDEPLLGAPDERASPAARMEALAPESVRRGHLRGILCADRLASRLERGVPAGPRFDERDQALLQGAAREILRAIRAERVFVAVERGKYEHERFFRASDLLNRALGPAQVFDTAFRAARELCEYDFAAITLLDENDGAAAHAGEARRATRRHRVAAVVGEQAAEFEDLAFADNAGLCAMAVKTRHPLPAGGEWRDKETPVFTRRARLRGMESVLVLPLIVADEPIGTFVLAAHAPRRFPKDKRELLGVITNQVAIAARNAETYRMMERMATTDGLTGLVNHRSFQERFADLLYRAERQGRRITLLITDVDHFKKVNDAHGHPIGDRVLKGVAAVCRQQVRKIDVAARYGGEEFALVLDGTDREGGRQLAERVRREVAAQHFAAADGGTFQCTMSLGMATFPDDGADPKTLIAKADQALYHAKHNGRNQAVAWADVQPRAAVLRAAR